MQYGTLMMPPSPRQTPSRKLVLIDDDETSHLIFKALLRHVETAVDCETYMSATDALARIENNNFDARLIILDVNMPGMSGWTFLEELEKISFTIPVYMLTSSDDYRDRARATEFDNVKGYFVKPLRLDHLKLIIENHWAN